MNPPSEQTPPSEPLLPETLQNVETPRKWLRLLGRIVRFFVLTTLGLVACVAGTIFAGYVYFSQNLPSVEKLKNYSPPTGTQFFGDNGALIAEFAAQRRFVVPIDQIPKMLQSAFVAAEDRDFLKPSKKAWWDVFHVFRKEFCGVSRIPHQDAKMFHPVTERGGRRMIREAIFWGRIERSLTKEHILFLYLNQIYLGSGAYGVEAAARTYFDKSVKDLTLAECAMIAGLPIAPSRLSPKVNLKKALERRSYVLKRMLEDSYITQTQYRRGDEGRASDFHRNLGCATTRP